MAFSSLLLAGLAALVPAQALVCAPSMKSTATAACERAARGGAETADRSQRKVRRAAPARPRVPSVVDVTPFFLL